MLLFKLLFFLNPEYTISLTEKYQNQICIYMSILNNFFMFLLKIKHKIISFLMEVPYHIKTLFSLLFMLQV